MEWYTVDDYGEFIKLFGHRKIGQQTFHWGAPSYMSLPTIEYPQRTSKMNRPNTFHQGLILGGTSY